MEQTERHLPDTATTMCAEALEQALSSVPFYRGWKALDPGPSRSVAERLSALPILSKKDLRTGVPFGFIHDSRSGREGFMSGEIELVATSGTASDRVSVTWHQPWWDRSENEAARLHPVLARVFSRAHREAVLTSPVCGAKACHVGNVPLEERIVNGLLFLNQSNDPTTWDASEIRRMAAELDRFRPEVIEADPAYLAILARACGVGGISVHQPACIVLTYEFPSCMHVRQIRKAFPDVPLVSSYGSTETGHVFTRCEAGRFHQNGATCHVEIQPLRPSRGDATVGRILVTTLDNPWFTLLRFDVGDLARLHLGAPCTCGRGKGTTVEAIEGRVGDVTFDTGGRAVTVKTLDDALSAAEGMVNYRVEQSGPGRYAIRFVAEPETARATAEILPELIRTVYGAGAEVASRSVSSLQPEPSGKFRLARTTFEWNPEELFA
jgi:phenylacetate-coenzyme A ligase PaaK-like adenylate-forming protein